MKFISTRRLIKIGDSFGFTLQGKLMERKGFRLGDVCKVTIELLESEKYKKRMLIKLSDELGKGYSGIDIIDKEGEGDEMEKESQK